VLACVQNQESLGLCSGLGFGLIGGWPCGLLLWVAECVGVAAAMYAPLPTFAAEQIVATLADAADPMLPGKNAGPLERLQRSATVLRAQRACSAMRS
jgi:hypothetical protein